MFPKSLVPGKPVSGHALLIPKAIIHQHVKRNLRFLLIAGFICAILFAVAQPASAQVILNIRHNRTLKVAGAGYSSNRRYLYTNVATGYNCTVIIINIQGTAAFIQH